MLDFILAKMSLPLGWIMSFYFILFYFILFKQAINIEPFLSYSFFC